MLADNGQGDSPNSWKRNWKGLLAAFTAGAAASALVAVIVVRASDGSSVVTAAGGTRGAITVPTVPLLTIPGHGASRPSQETTLPAPTTSTTLTPLTPGPALTGMVADSGGRPVPGAYVIGLNSLTVVRTDSSGRYAMPCKVTQGALTGQRDEPLVAAMWILPVIPSGQGSYAVGVNTTQYGPPPTAAGLGYVFSGGSSDAAHASDATCDGRPVNFALPAGGGADVQFLNADGSPVSPSQFQGPPVDNLYMPGLGAHAALDTSPLSADGRQVLMQMGPGLFGLDVLYPMTCTEAGTQLSPSQAAMGLGVRIVAGQVVHVTCRMTAGGSAGSTPPQTA